MTIKAQEVVLLVESTMKTVLGCVLYRAGLKFQRVKFAANSEYPRMSSSSHERTYSTTLDAEGQKVLHRTQRLAQEEPLHEGATLDVG
jgi:hypothetical protein